MAEPREIRSRDARRDDPARFLRELRELRKHSGLDHAELAARAHYPCDVIKAAEAGPSLPDLPVLSAYVRGCGGPLTEWEERWRAVTGSPATPLLAARTAGCSEAADAGARVGAVSAIADGHDPDRVMAALNRVVDGMTAAASPTSPTSSPSGAGGSMLTSPALSDPAVSDTGVSDRAISDTGISHGALSDSTGFDVWQPRRTASGAWTSHDPIFDEAVFEELAASPAVPDPAPAPDAAVWDPARAADPASWDLTTATGAAAWDRAPLTDAPTWNSSPTTSTAKWNTTPATAAVTPQAGSSQGRGVSRTVLIAVALLLVVTVLVLFA